MKYQGTIRIVDVVGVVFERALSEEEMIAALVANQQSTLNQGALDTGGVEPTAKKKKPVPTEPKVDGLKECCGAKRKKHLKTCKSVVVETVAPVSAREKASKANRHKVDDRHAFSESTYDSVRKMLETETVDFTSSTKGLDLEEVRRVNLADDFQDYLDIA